MDRNRDWRSHLQHQHFTPHPVAMATSARTTAGQRHPAGPVETLPWLKLVQLFDLGGLKIQTPQSRPSLAIYAGCPAPEDVQTGVFGRLSIVSAYLQETGRRHACSKTGTGITENAPFGAGANSIILLLQSRQPPCSFISFRKTLISGLCLHSLNSLLDNYQGHHQLLDPFRYFISI